MQKKSVILLWLLIAAALLCACGGGRSTGQPAETISVRTAKETIADNQKREVCVSGYPVAFFLSYTYTGAKMYNVYFSDRAEDYFGELEASEEISDEWLEVICKEKDPLWKSMREIFEGEQATEQYRILLKGTKSHVSGYYYDFVDFAE